MTSFYSLRATAHDGQPHDFHTHQGRAVLVVNIASQCSFTPQLAELETLWQAWRERGLTVVGLPCDQFGRQSPGSSSELVQFCRMRYGVTFPVLAKGEVYGPNAEPVFLWLAREAPGWLGWLGGADRGRPRWNFTKFLVSPDAGQVKRFAPWTRPQRLEPTLARWLGTQAPTP